MKFTAFWNEVLSQNSALKWGIVSVSSIALGLGFSLVSLALREPLVIERGCVTEVVKPAASQATPDEIGRFARLAIPKRFDSDATDSQLYLTPEETATRVKELDELGRKGMAQRVLVGSVKVEGGKVRVEADRLLSFGKLRTVLAMRLQLSLKTVDRTPGNPFGLILADVAVVANEEENK